jgi:hypothetical protein
VAKDAEVEAGKGEGRYCLKGGGTGVANASHSVFVGSKGLGRIRSCGTSMGHM